MKPEQNFDKLSNTIVNTLILYRKIEMGHKNVWLDGIKELLAVNSKKYTSMAHQKLIDCCKSNISFESGFHTFENIFKKSITPTVLKIEHKKPTIDYIFNGCTDREKLRDVIGWIKFVPRKVPLPKCYLDWVNEQDEETKEEIRKYYKRKDNESKNNKYNYKRNYA